MKIIISTIASTVILFLWSGLTQLFPWGVPTAQTITAQTTKQTKSFQTPNLITLPANSLTTERFDSQFVDKISTYTTDKTFSWIITQPLSQYDVGAYFTKEVITQLLVSLLLALLLYMTVKLDTRTRVLIAAIAGFAAVTGIYGQMLNWWGMPALYALGAGVNLIIGWTIAAFISARFIMGRPSTPVENRLTAENGE